MATFSNNDPSLYVEHNGKQVKVVKSHVDTYGYPKGITKILLKIGQASPGQQEAIYIKGVLVGIVDTVSPSATPGYEWVNLQEPTKTSFTLYTCRKRYVEVRTEGVKGPTYTIEYHDTVWFTALGSPVSEPNINDKVLIKKRSLGVARIAAKNTQQVFATFSFKPKGLVPYKIRVTRKSSSSSKTYRIFDKLTLTNLATRFDRKPILTTNRHVFLEVKIRATNQLNGAISNLSAIAESILDVWNPDTNQWEKKKTNNPAWVFADLLTGNCNKKAISKDRLHLPSLLEWSEFSDAIPTPPPLQSFTTKRFETNFILDFETTLQSILNTVANAAQASLNIIDGKYGVLLDKQRDVPVQIFTPRNSYGFSSSRSYSETPHALKIRYVNPSKSWEISEQTVYDNGYTEETATVFEELSSFACTNPEQAWRFGRYMLAQARLRKEVITINVDFEYLVCTRGDYVQITQDVMRAGGRPARVKEVTGNIIKIDDGIDTIGGVDYGYIYRSVEDGIQSSTLTVLDSDEFELDGGIPAVGDLIVIGEMNKVAFDCIVKSINPSSDLSAVLELVEKADDIYVAESSETIGAYSPQLSLNVDTEQATPPAVEDFVLTDNSWRVQGGGYEYYIGLDWDVPVGAAYETFEIYMDNGTGYTLWDFTQKSSFEYIVNHKDLGSEHKFKVLAVSSTGKKIPLLESPEVTATPIRKVTPPSNVTGLNLNITNQIIQLDWPRVTDIDLSNYLIRYSSRTENANWQASIPMVAVDKSTTSTSVQARTGTYLIKAVDLNGNESSIPAMAITTIPQLMDLNLIEETNDFPALEGQLDTTEIDGGLVLKKLNSATPATTEYYTEGYYYYKNLLDLGEIYTVRLQSLIEAEGLSIADIMANWDNLADVPFLSRAGQSEWDVETQYRTTDSFNVMSTWSSLDDIIFLSQGDEDIWTEWKKFTMGDATGRIFQFRLKLISKVAHVTPRVFNGVIRADMPDRSEDFGGLSATADGLEVAYTDGFKGPGTSPIISITQDSAQQGDYFVFEYKNLNGFKIKFYDKNNIAVPRSFDAYVKGYGRRATSTI